MTARKVSYISCPSPPQRKLMKILKDVDDVRFVAECDPELGFMPLNIECRHCGRRIDPHSSGASLTCACGHAARAFWSEAQMHVFIAEAWDGLRQTCAHARSAALKIS
jgi:nucleotidyltransferase/DNA polymerase involved in DNA repair